MVRYGWILHPGNVAVGLVDIDKIVGSVSQSVNSDVNVHVT